MFDFSEKYEDFILKHDEEDPAFVSSVLPFVDNVAVASSLIVGNSRSASLSAPAFATQLLVAYYRIRVWWEYIDSKANISDGGSRVGVSDPVALSLGVTLKHSYWPVQSGAFMSPDKIKREIIGQLLF